MENTDIRVIPEFNEEMEIVTVTIECDSESVLNMMDKERLQELLNKELGEQYNINVEVTETQFRELQDNGTVKINLVTETVIKENNSILLDENDVDMEDSNFIAETNKIFRDSRSCSIAKKVNRTAGDILADYMEDDYRIIGAIIRRGMAVYKTVFTMENGEFYVESFNAGNIEINLLDKINDSVHMYSTGMDSRNVVSMIEQIKDNTLFLQLEVEFPDGNITGKYKLQKLSYLREQVDISF